MIWILIALWTITTILIFLGAIFSSSATWYTTQAGLWWTDPTQARARQANKPWHVRLSDKLAKGDQK